MRFKWKSVQVSLDLSLKLENELINERTQECLQVIQDDREEGNVPSHDGRRIRRQA